jgi:hypothetical protein
MRFTIMYITVITNDSSLRCKLCTCIDFSDKVVVFYDRGGPAELSEIFNFADVLLIVDMSIANAFDAINAAKTRNWNVSILPIVSLRNGTPIIEELHESGIHWWGHFPSANVEMKAKIKYAVAEYKARMNSRPADDKR